MVSFVSSPSPGAFCSIGGPKVPSYYPYLHLSLHFLTHLIKVQTQHASFPIFPINTFCTTSLNFLLLSDVDKKGSWRKQHNILLLTRKQEKKKTVYPLVGGGRYVIFLLPDLYDPDKNFLNDLVGRQVFLWRTTFPGA